MDANNDKISSKEHHQTMNCDQFIQQNEARIHDIYKKKILEHPDSGKISSYIISNGEMNPEQEETNNYIFAKSVSEVAEELGVKLEE